MNDFSRIHKDPKHLTGGVHYTSTHTAHGEQIDFFVLDEYASFALDNQERIARAHDYAQGAPGMPEADWS